MKTKVAFDSQDHPKVQEKSIHKLYPNYIEMENFKSKDHWKMLCKRFIPLSKMNNQISKFNPNVKNI